MGQKAAYGVRNLTITEFLFFFPVSANWIAISDQST